MSTAPCSTWVRANGHCRLICALECTGACDIRSARSAVHCCKTVKIEGACWDCLTASAAASGGSPSSASEMLSVSDIALRESTKWRSLKFIIVGEDSGHEGGNRSTYICHAKSLIGIEAMRQAPLWYQGERKAGAHRSEAAGSRSLISPVIRFAASMAITAECSACSTITATIERGLADRLLNTIFVPWHTRVICGASLLCSSRVSSNIPSFTCSDQSPRKMLRE